MELEMEQRSGILLTVSHFITGIRTLIKRPTASKGTFIKSPTGLKHFYKTEQLLEPLEIIEVHEMVEMYKAINMTRII